MEFDEFYDRMSHLGLEDFNKFYSLYNGVVTSLADPNKQGRIRAKVEEVGHDTELGPEIWAYPAIFPGAGNNRGWFWPPEVGDPVLIAFPNGNLNNQPIYFGGWFAKGWVPPELGYPEGDKTEPKRRGFVTRMGHSFILNEEADKEAVELTWRKPSAQPSDNKSAARDGDSASLKFTKDGIELKAKNESSITINVTDKKVVILDKDNSNTITLDSNGVTIKTSGKVVIDGASEFNAGSGSVNLGTGAAKSAVYGEDLLQWLNSHTHPTGVGPSGPPTPPATSALLSQSVKVK